MLVKALVSFAGAVTMNTGDTADIDEKTAVSLISCGLAEEAEISADNETGNETDGDCDKTVGNNSRKGKKVTKN